MASCRAEAVEKQAAKTRYDVLQRYRQHTFVRCKPATGRFHQIRVHLATIGHPVVADEFYEAFGTVRPPRARPLSEADKRKTYALSEDDDGEEGSIEEGVDGIAPAAEDEGAGSSPLLQRHALHAHRIAFTHPITHEWMEFAAPLALDMQRAVKRLAAEAGIDPVVSD